MTARDAIPKGMYFLQFCCWFPFSPSRSESTVAVGCSFCRRSETKTNGTRSFASCSNHDRLSLSRPLYLSLSLSVSFFCMWMTTNSWKTKISYSEWAQDRDTQMHKWKIEKIKKESNIEENAIWICIHGRWLYNLCVYVRESCLLLSSWIFGSLHANAKKEPRARRQKNEKRRNGERNNRRLMVVYGRVRQERSKENWRKKISRRRQRRSDNNRKYERSCVCVQNMLATLAVYTQYIKRRRRRRHHRRRRRRRRRSTTH